MRELIELRIEAKITVELVPGFLDEELAALFARFNSLHPWNEMTLGVGVR